MLSYIAGKLCEVLLPINESVYIGRGNDIAVCTLASIDLLRDIASDKRIMDRITIAGRLLSENRGIEKLIESAINNDLKYIILVGEDSKGHHAGQALIALHRNGIDSNGRIIGAIGKKPFLTICKDRVDEFRSKVKLIDAIGVRDRESVYSLICSIC